MYFVPPHTFCAGSYAFVTPRPFAVPGISCISPWAPTLEVALALNPDSFAMIALTSAGSTPKVAAFPLTRRSICSGGTIAGAFATGDPSEAGSRPLWSELGGFMAD